MTLPTKHYPPHLVLLTSYFVLALALALANAAPPGAATPYTFVGRVMDSTRAGFDTNRVCTLKAFSADGQPLAVTRTFFNENSRNNYALKIPVATAAADGYALLGDSLSITATDDLGKVWQGVIPESLCGEPGGVREVDIVLGEDADGDGIDDALLEQLLAQWEDSLLWSPDADFDPRDDHDGDCVSSLDEALSGTDPFDATSFLAITGMTRTDAGVDIRFPAAAGRTYEIQTTPSLFPPEWSSTTPATTLSTPSTARSDTVTLHLLPSTNQPAFYRLRVE